MVHLGKTAKYLRERKGLKQVEAAKALDITQVHLSNVENNKALPSQKLIDRYREVFGVDLYMLAWCLFGDSRKLPKAVQGPMKALADAWRRQLGDVVGSA